MAIGSQARRGVLALIAGSSLMLVVGAAAADGRYTELVLSDQKGGKPRQVFATDTPKLNLAGTLVDVAAGAKLKCAWIAEKTKVAPPNYEIDTKEMEVFRLMNSVDFSLTKPNAGWPVGDYRVDLSINGKVVQQVRFKVQ